MSVESLKEAIEDLKYKAIIVRDVLRYRPFFTCPFCKGAGGAVSGYEEPEWSECRNCYEYWESVKDHGFSWFVGRIPLREYIRARIAIYFGHWDRTRTRDIIRCKLGLHRWHKWEGTTGGHEFCCICYEPKYKDFEVPENFMNCHMCGYGSSKESFNIDDDSEALCPKCQGTFFTKE